MLPVEILIHEHRLIERMVATVENECDQILATNNVDPNFIVTAVDFFRTYADRYHHGKEEGILFKGLNGRQLTNEDRTMMLELMNEHAFARRTVTNLVYMKDKYVAGEKERRGEILELLRALIDCIQSTFRRRMRSFSTHP